MLGAEGELTVDLDTKTSTSPLIGIVTGGFALQRAEIPETRYLTFRAGIVQRGNPESRILSTRRKLTEPQLFLSYYGDLIVGAAEFQRERKPVSSRLHPEMPTAWTGCRPGLDVIWKTSLSQQVRVSWRDRRHVLHLSGRSLVAEILSSPMDSFPSQTTRTPEEHLDRFSRRYWLRHF